MDEITADHLAFRTTVADLGSAAARLAEDRDRATRSVDALLDTWSGTVATSYAEGWEAWRLGSARVLTGLETMSRLLEAADADLARADVTAGSELGRLDARLG